MRIFRGIIYIFLFNFFIVKMFGSFENEKIFFDKVLNTGNINSMITQDKEGIIWIATTGGIVKFDGYKSTLITANQNSINSNLVPCIYIDSKGLVWIVTLSGLNSYNKENDSFEYYKSNSTNKKTISSNLFNWAPDLICEDSKGNIWIGTQNGVNKYDKTLNEFKRFLPKKSIWGVFADSSDNIWVATEKNGLYKIEENNENVRKINELNSKWIYAVNEDKNKNIWIGTKYDGLFKLNPKNNFLEQFNNESKEKRIFFNEVFSIMIDDKNKLWLGRNYKNSIGLEVFDPEKNTSILYTSDSNNKFSLSGNTILSVFRDVSGNIWIPDNLGPIDVIDKRKPRFNNLREIKGIMNIYEDKSKNIWLGTITEGLYKFKDNIITNYNSKNSNVHDYVFSILNYTKDKLWLGLGNGELAVFDKNKGKIVERYKNPLGQITARSLIQDNKNTDFLWFGTEGHGIFRFDKKTKMFKRYIHNSLDYTTLASNQAQRLVQDNEGNIWIPTHGEGIDKFNKKTEIFTHYKNDPSNPYSISGNQVIDFFIDSKGRYFISTDEGGLNYFDKKTERFIHFGQENGFETNSIRSIKEDNEGFLWLSSNKGLYKFDFEKKQVVANYTKQDGLSDDQFSIFVSSSLKAANGELWFTTNNGVNIFDPKKIKINHYNPNIIITSLKQGGENVILNKSVEVIDRIILDWRHNYFEFEYAALNYTLPEKSKYKYKLEGIDKEWYEAGNKRFGRYSGLSGGDYTLRIKGTNNDGIWSEKEARLQIKVVPAFWQTTRFKVLFSIFVILTTIIWYYLKMSSLKKQKSYLESQVKLRTEELNMKNIQLTDSIQYAKRIQNVILPEPDTISENFSDFFLIYFPRDIVSGDFYWYSKQGDDIFISLVDCTGHGVPGALLATIGNMLLNKHINEHQTKKVDLILEGLDKDIKKLLSVHEKNSSDGMDLSICKINFKEKTLIFAGAKCPLIYFTKEGKFIRIKGTKRSIGGRKHKNFTKFKSFELDLRKIYSFYMLTDGYVDQLNKENRSFSYSKFSKIMEEIYLKSFEEQKISLEKNLNNYMKEQSQTDDITVIGFKI